MIKSDLRILEKIFEKEIFGLVYQSKAKRLEWLRDNGYVEAAEITLPGRIPIRVSGWVLTHKGRFAYCDTCREEPEPCINEGGD